MSSREAVQAVSSKRYLEAVLGGGCEKAGEDVACVCKCDLVERMDIESLSTHSIRSSHLICSAKVGSFPMAETYVVVLAF
jgi:hypothetical protein